MFTLSARSLDDVRDALARGPVGVTAFSQDNRRILGNGTLLLIDNVVDQASATMRLKAVFASEDEQLWPGDFVNARASLKVLRGALTLGGRRRGCGPTASDRIRTTTDGRTTITSGLAEGDRVVVNGQYKLRRNSKMTLTLPEPVVAESGNNRCGILIGQELAWLLVMRSW